MTSDIPDSRGKAAIKPNLYNCTYIPNGRYAIGLLRLLFQGHRIDGEREQRASGQARKCQGQPRRCYQVSEV